MNYHPARKSELIIIEKIAIRLMKEKKEDDFVLKFIKEKAKGREATKVFKNVQRKYLTEYREKVKIALSNNHFDAQIIQDFGNEIIQSKLEEIITQEKRLWIRNAQKEATKLLRKNYSDHSIISQITNHFISKEMVENFIKKGKSAILHQTKTARKEALNAGFLAIGGAILLHIVFYVLADEFQFKQYISFGAFVFGILKIKEGINISIPKF